jgi:hypothetical protein
VVTVGVVGGDAEWWCRRGCSVGVGGGVVLCWRRIVVRWGLVLGWVRWNGGLVAWGCLDLFLALVFCPDAPERARYVDTPC